MKQRAPALPDSPTFQQLWDALGSKLIESAREHLLYTQGVTGSSPVPPISTNNLPDLWLFLCFRHRFEVWAIALFSRLCIEVQRVETFQRQ